MLGKACFLNLTWKMFLLVPACHVLFYSLMNVLFMSQHSQTHRTLIFVAQKLKKGFNNLKFAA